MLSRSRGSEEVVGAATTLTLVRVGIGSLESATLFRAQFLDGELLSRRQRLRRGNLHIGLDPRSFPVGLGDRIDGPRERHTDDEVVINPLASNRMRAAPGSPQQSWRVSDSSD